jgi:hypothetical protein
MIPGVDLIVNKRSAHDKGYAMSLTIKKVILHLALLAICLFGPAVPAAANQFGIVPNNGSGNYCPSVSADGNKIAFLTDVTSGNTATVKVYDRSAGTTTTCSLHVTYVGRPRISRDGSFVTYFGTPDYYSSGSLMSVPIVANTSSGSWVAALARTGTNTTTTWATWLSPIVAGQAPGIKVSSGAWTVSFGDLVDRVAEPDGEDYVTKYWVCTSNTQDGNAAHVYYTPNESCRTDISDNGVITYAYQGEIYANGSVLTSTGGTCMWPSINSAGTKIAYETTASGGTLSGSNVKIVTISTATSITPYSVASGQSNVGSATHPFISSDGGTVAFNCSSTHLNFAYSYSFSGSPTYACQTATSSGGNATALSADYSSYPGTCAVKPASNACAFNLSANLAGCFDTSDTSLPYSWGSYGTGSNILKGY